MNIMKLLDIHTHHNHHPQTAILNCTPGQVPLTTSGYYSVGFHPWTLATHTPEDWTTFELEATHPQVLAIGEAGIDKLTTTADVSTQTDAFIRQALLAEKLCKPLIIHCVKAHNEIMQLHRRLSPRQAWVMHGFRGKKELAGRLLSNGFYLSFGQRYPEETLRHTPLDRMFMETDESTTPIHHLYEAAARCLNITPEQLIAQVQQNIRLVFFQN